MSIKALLIDLSLSMKDENAQLLQYLSKSLHEHTTKEISPNSLQQHLEQNSILEQYTVSIYQRLNQVLPSSLLDNTESLMDVFRDTHQKDVEREFNRYWDDEHFQKLLKSVTNILLAVNPLVPIRLESLKDYPISYVSHAGNTHYFKPSLHYYAEILARSTLEPDEILLVHTDTQSLEIFKRLGIATWNMLNNVEWEEPNQLVLHPDAVIAQLQANVSALYGLLDQVAYIKWQIVLIPKEWTIAQNIAHLLEKEIFNYRPLILRVLSESDAFITEYATSLNPIIDISYQENLSALLEHFLLERVTTINLLQAIDESMWKRIFQHNVFGTTTLIEMVYFIAQHDRMHIRQICQLLQNCM